MRPQSRPLRHLTRFDAISLEQTVSGKHAGLLSLAGDLHPTLRHLGSDDYTGCSVKGLATPQ